MGGHVFVTRGDLTKLACDAWLLPTDIGFHVLPHWRRALSSEQVAMVDRLHAGQISPPEGWGTNDVRVRPLEPWPTEIGTSRPYLVNVGAYAGKNIQWYVTGVRQFFQEVADRQMRSALPGRKVPLVALPLVGVGAGGAAEEKGNVVRHLLPALYEEVGKFHIDAVLVLWDGSAFVAAQNARRRYLDERWTGGSMQGWPELDPELLKRASALAEDAAKGHLVLFLGAGVSMAAGLPGWDDLLDRLAERAGLTAEERVAITRLHALDRARLIRSALEAKQQRVGTSVQALLSWDRYALIHSLLASLPVSEAVTTNYDGLFEQASADAGRPLCVLPYERAKRQVRWLLKLHGCVKHPEDIVLTREDYLRYADTRAALAGIVQALLITRHMLFVGFSLTDDNFHRIVDDVRKAIREPQAPAVASEPFGTALFLRHDPLLERLWHGDLDYVAVAPQASLTEGDTVRQDGEAARQLEVFLDYLLAEASQGASPLLDPAYDAVLSENEREIATLLRALDARASQGTRRSPAWLRVEALLNEFRGQSA